MINQNLARGLFVAAIALAFGLGALRYRIGDLVHPQPGLFPLMISSLLFVIAVLIVVRSRFEAPVSLEFSVRNIGFILLALGCFVGLSKFANMALGIVALVFVAALAGTSYSWWRNLKISAGLLAVAFAFQMLLGLNLRLL